VTLVGIDQKANRQVTLVHGGDDLLEFGQFAADVVLSVANQQWLPDLVHP
jgi:hypothetical protein